MARLSSNLLSSSQEKAVPDFIGFVGGIDELFPGDCTLQFKTAFQILHFAQTQPRVTKKSTMTIFHLVLLFLRPSWRVEGSAGSVSSWGCEEGSWFLYIPTLQQPWSCVPYYQKGPDLCSHQAALLRYRIYRITEVRAIVIEITNNRATSHILYFFHCQSICLFVSMLKTKYV